MLELKFLRRKYNKINSLCSNSIQEKQIMIREEEEIYKGRSDHNWYSGGLAVFVAGPYEVADPILNNTGWPG